MDFWNQSSKHEQLAEPQTKRISTPAGQRLSVILENGNTQSKMRESHRASMRKSGLATAITGDALRESGEDQSNNSSGYSYSVWSEGEKFAALKNNKQIAKRGGWKRFIAIILVLLAIIIALAVGLAVGLKKKGSSSNNDKSSSSQAAGAAESNTSSPNNPTATASPTVQTLSPSALPSNFPVGSYSFVTFLDTIYTNCTSLASTWTCYPYTIYNTSPSKSIATFNWIISGSGSNLKISSTENPFSISFQGLDLTLKHEGQDDEGYYFQLQTVKTVSPSSSITDDDAAVECDYNDSTLTGWLYTKMQKGYPDASRGDGTGNPSFPTWPFAVKVEQTAAGGEGVPSCHKTSSPQSVLTNVVEAQDGGALCSCLYKNWRPPIPT
ncbi:hypothetical protein K504DRAFT_498365 [Pleomassaria siparia CBS 279.74]|uniref:Tat pathway signal sequence n=1 Tax=Pleomassaria siparia CBS 279.74 TaxID=1314801 RepID=A0A6G1KL46_9PLEO|nr:hypothetical protein K504DRAFT_498365 [Pleomassaria siparia CBS 279.74]